MRKPNISVVYLDMDGVIADFEKRYKELFHMEPREAEKNNKFKPFFKEFIANNNFATLEVMPGTDLGLKFLKNADVPVEILSSTAKEEYYNDISKQKSLWLQKHGINYPAIFVPGKRFKKDYAGPDKILIDDTKVNIDQWNEAGGIGIWHKDWPSTISILTMYI